MQSRKGLTADQRRWWDWQAERGCYLGLGPPCLHHCVGSTARHRKVDIGQWWVIPLSYDAHQGPQGIHGDLSIFGTGETRKEIEKRIFADLSGRYLADGEHIPAEVIEAIEGYHR